MILIFFLSRFAVSYSLLLNQLELSIKIINYNMEIVNFSRMRTPSIFLFKSTKRGRRDLPYRHTCSLDREHTSDCREIITKMQKQSAGVAMR